MTRIKKKAAGATPPTVTEMTMVVRLRVRFVDLQNAVAFALESGHFVPGGILCRADVRDIHVWWIEEGCQTLERNHIVVSDAADIVRRFFPKLIPHNK